LRCPAVPAPEPICVLSVLMASVTAWSLSTPVPGARSSAQRAAAAVLKSTSCRRARQQTQAALEWLSRHHSTSATAGWRHLLHETADLPAI
jgi:hypothetical protein